MMTNKLFSYLYLVFIGLTSILFFIIALLLKCLTFRFDKRLVALHLFSSFWGCFYLWCLPGVSVSIKGREKLNWKKNYVFVSNHQSQLDILVAFGLFFPFKWVSKSEVFKLPFIGWNMTLNRYIGLKRGDKKSIQTMMQRCEMELNQGSSLFFFPEGTRSETGELKPFKPGAFILAKKMKVPIVPVAVNGTLAVMPKYSLTLSRNHRLSLTVLNEIPYAAFSQMDPKELADGIRALIARHVDVH